MEITTLTELLVRHGVPAEFGILSVDAEGIDLEVLKGLDFDRFKPSVIVAEEYYWNREKQAAKFALLVNKGYELVQKAGNNTIWKASTPIAAR